MDAGLKKILKAVTLELRHLLEGKYDANGRWQPGDLEDRLSSIGVWREREPIPLDELDHLSDQDKYARKVIDAYLAVRNQAGVSQEEAVAEFVRETAYTWANRLLALRCMEARELIDEVILQKEVYGGRSLKHNRLAQRQPETCTGEDDGLFAVLENVFAERAQTLPTLFDPESPGIALRPSPSALKQCIGLLSGSQTVRSVDPATGEVFQAPDALGWAYQYWNTEEKDRVFEKVRTVKGAKIAGADIIPATQLYTEDYMVKFLVQNSLGATWMGMYPESQLFEQWEYYVRDADRVPATQKPVAEITFLDPACGSGHFLIEAFDLYYSMYEEEGTLTDPGAICRSILEHNLFGIDIDQRAVQIAEAALWMKAAERAFEFDGAPTGLVAAVSSHLMGKRWEEFLDGFEKEPSVARVLRRFAHSMEHIDVIGSLARPAEDLRAIIKDEHGTWERQIREKQEANFLFADMREDALSGQLPFQEITDEEFGERLFYRAKAALDAFTQQARERGEFQDQMLGREAAGGFHLLDVLSRKYNVVAANPPYMGSRKMSVRVRSYIDTNFEIAKRDLYAAFLVRAMQLCCNEGYFAFVTMHSWQVQSSFELLRASILSKARITAIANLARYAFAECDPPGFAVLLVAQCRKPNESHRIVGFRQRRPNDSQVQAENLRLMISGKASRYIMPQSTILRLPGQSIVYWLPESLVTLIAGDETLSSQALVSSGMQTGNNNRLTRFVWECFGSNRWQPYAKGGGYRKWRGFENIVTDWRQNGQLFRLCPSARLVSRDVWFGECLTYSYICRGSLGVRFISNSAFDNASMLIKPNVSSERYAIAASLNSRFVSYVLRAVSGAVMFQPGQTAFAPISQAAIVDALLDSGARLCERLSIQELRAELTDWFAPDPQAMTRNGFLALMECAALRHGIEGLLESRVASLCGLNDHDLEAAYRETGTPTGCYPMMKTHDLLPYLDWTRQNGDDSVFESLKKVEHVGYSLDEERQYWTKLNGYYSNGPGVISESSTTLIEDSFDEEEEDVAGSDDSIPMPVETFLEELVQCIGLHPFSVFAMVKTGVVDQGWRCPPEEKRFAANLATYALLRFFGHVWPEEHQKDQLPEVAKNKDGIALLVCESPQAITALTKDVLSIVNHEVGGSGGKSFEEEFENVNSVSLGQWLSSEFFCHHVKQFKKRPIVWQLQSGYLTTRLAPAFACMVYYHKVEVDALPKIRSQYVGPLRQRMETELRGIESVASDARTDRQDQRRVELDDAIAELQKFDSALEAIITSGFGPKALLPKLRQYAIDDAMLCLEARWLRRLTELIAKQALTKWLNAADRTGLHPELSSWIEGALMHLDHHCSRVGPKPPDQAKLKTDPTAKELADLIKPHAAAMMENSIKFACAVWWKPFDEAVLGPLKEQVKQLKAEQKECQDALKADLEPTPTEARKLNARVKEIKAKIKELNKRIAEKSKPVEKIREQIEEWRSDEPKKWGDWLSKQPTFDQISSLDDRRAPPTTIAEFIAQESLYAPDINDGVRVNIAPLQKAGLLAADVLAKKDIDKAIADRAEWRSDERRWVREGKLPQPGWWPENEDPRP